MTHATGHVVRIERTFAAPAEAVFDAWTNPEVMRRWFHCGPDDAQDWGWNGCLDQLGSLLDG